VQIAWGELSADEVLLALRSGAAGASGFLDVHQWLPLQQSSSVQFGGGHPNAQLRCVALEHAPEIAYWRLDVERLPHDIRSARQLRGALYREGAPEGSLGDIVVGSQVMVVAAPEVDLSELVAGAERTADWTAPAVQTEQATVSALRLDAVVAPLFRISRSEAQTAIEYGFVFLNFAPAKKKTLAVKAVDQLVFRTKGRIEIVDASGTTKSGRVGLRFNRFPM